MNSPIINVSHVGKRFRKGEYATSLRDTLGELLRFRLKRGQSKEDRTFWALRDINFELKKGDFLGVIGINGAGKSTLLKLLAGILLPNEGHLEVRGRISALIELVAGLHPDLTGLENIFLAGAIMGLSKQEIRDRLESIIRFSGLAEFIDTPLKRYSSGMHVRLGFSVAIHVDPDILLLDEILAVGDAEFRKKCFERMENIAKTASGVILVSHNMAHIASMCNRAILLDSGRVLADGTARDVIHEYERHLASRSREQVPETRITEDYDSTASSVLITKVELLNRQGKEKREFRMRESVRIRIHYVCHEPIQEAGFLVACDRHDGVRCFLLHSAEVAPRDFESGPGTIEVDIKTMDTLPGTYDLIVAVSDKDYRFCYTIHRGEFITVTADRDFDERFGVTSPAATWDFRN